MTILSPKQTAQELAKMQDTCVDCEIEETQLEEEDQAINDDL